MKNLEIAGDITYFTINGDIYGVDSTDSSAVRYYDDYSPVERVDYVDMCNILELSDIDQTENYDEYATRWHLDGFDVVACGSELYIEEHYYMNIPTGSVDTASNWAAEGFIPAETEHLVRVTKDSSGEWTEVA